MEFNFRLADTSKKKQKKLWIEKIPIEHQDQFEEYNVKMNKKRKLSEKTKFLLAKTRTKNHINEKLKDTEWTLDLLEKKHSNDTIMHYVFDIKGNVVWVNPVITEYFNRSLEEFLLFNYVDYLSFLHKDHPFTEVFINLLQDQPKKYKVASSIRILDGSNFSFIVNLERIETKGGTPFGYLGHLITDMEKEE
eukprot:gene8054-12516_t